MKSETTGIWSRWRGGSRSLWWRVLWSLVIASALLLPIIYGAINLGGWYIIPDAPPGPGAEWTLLSRTGPNNEPHRFLGETHWRLNDDGDGEIAEGVATVPDDDLALTLSVRPDSSPHAYLIEIEVNSPDSFGVLRTASLAATRRDVRDSVTIESVHREISGTTVTFRFLSVGGQQIGSLFEDFDAIGITLTYWATADSYDDSRRRDLNLWMSLGDSGHAVFDEALAAWGVAPGAN